MNPAILPQTLSKSLADLYGERLALKDIQSGREWTYHELHRQTQHWLAYLAHQQIKPGSVVIWITKNNVDFYAMLLACKEMNLTLLPLNWRESLSVQISVINLAQPAIIFYESLFESTAIHLQRLKGIPADEVSNVLAWQPDKKFVFDFKSDHSETAPWYLLFTSGTTGEPKAVIYNWAMHRANVNNVLSKVSLDSSDRTLATLPHYHTAGINLFALPVLMNGGSVRVFQDAKPEILLDDLLQERVNVVLLVPTLFQKIADLPNFTQLSQSGAIFKLVASGGAPLALDLWQRWQQQGLVIQNGCGLTESGPTLFLQTHDEALAHPTAVGTPVEGIEVKLMGPDGSEVNPGESGEIWLHGEAITPGYWRNAKANGQAFRNEWFRTGDVAQCHNGQYEIVDRMSDMFICGGENVYPSEIEECITRFNGVEEVVVMGESHRIWGETGVAFVVCKPGNFLNEEDILNFCKTRLARYKVPKRIEFVDELPKTATGKIRRGIVQDWVKK